MKGKIFAVIFTGSLLLFLLVSCASVPEDTMISTVQAEEVQVVQETAKQLAYLDGTHILGNPDLAAAAQLLSDLQVALEDTSLPAAARSQLVAFRGRVNLILGDKKSA